MRIADVQRHASTIALLASCLLAGAWWLLAGTFYGAFTSGSEVAGAVAAVALLLGLSGPKLTLDRSSVPLIAAGALLFGGTAFTLAVGSSSGIYSGIVPLSFVPLLCWFFTARRSVHLFAALASIAAALLIFPVEIPRTVLGWVDLVIPPVSAAAGIVLAAHTVRRNGGKLLTNAVLLASGIALAISIGFFVGPTRHAGGDVTPTRVGTLYDAAASVLSCVALAGLPALRYASFYPASVLLTIAAGYILYFQNTLPRMWIGLLLLLLAIIGLWRQPREDPDPSVLHLR